MTQPEQGKFASVSILPPLFAGEGYVLFGTLDVPFHGERDELHRQLSQIPGVQTSQPILAGIVRAQARTYEQLLHVMNYMGDYGFLTEQQRTQMLAGVPTSPPPTHTITLPDSLDVSIAAGATRVIPFISQAPDQAMLDALARAAVVRDTLAGMGEVLDAPEMRGTPLQILREASRQGLFTTDEGLFIFHPTQANERAFAHFAGAIGAESPEAAHSQLLGALQSVSGDAARYVSTAPSNVSPYEGITYGDAVVREIGRRLEEFRSSLPDDSGTTPGDGGSQRRPGRGRG